MDTTYDFTFGFAQRTKAEAESADRRHKRQVLQTILTGISLINLCLGFSVFGVLTIVNRHQGDLNGCCSGSSLAMAGGAGAILLGAVFLVAACAYLRLPRTTTSTKPTENSNLSDSCYVRIITP